MAFFYATLEVGGISKEILDYSFFAIRKRDSRGRSVSNTAWTVMISLNAIREEVFTEWMIDPTKKKDITISFTDSSEENPKKWNFTNVFCVGFNETYIEDLGHFQTDIVLTGESMTNGNATLEYDWGM